MDVYPFATMDTTSAIKNKENEIYAGLDLTRVVKPAGYPAADAFTVPNTNNYVAKVQAIAGSQRIGPSLTLKVMKGDSINIRVSSWYKLNGATPTTPPINTTLANIVGSLISGISGSAIVNTHGISSTEFNTANSFTPDVTSFLNNQTNTNYNTTKPKAYLNWIYFDEQFNIVSSSSGADQVGTDQQLKPHVQQTVATKCGFLYVYVSNETPNIPVYFDNLQISHIRSPLLETNEYYPYGLKMANISYKASMTMTNRYGFNGGNEYEDEGELNYSNTFYRKYDAQIGRFTGVDMLAEATASITPYNFGNGNPVMFSDPTGAFNCYIPTGANGRVTNGRNQKGGDGNYHVGWYNDLMWGGIDGDYGTRGDGERDGGSGGGGGGSSFSSGLASLLSGNNNFGGTWKNNANGGSLTFFGSDAQAFTAGAAYADKFNMWGLNGAASSFAAAQNAYYTNGGTDVSVGMLSQAMLPGITVYGNIRNGTWQTRNVVYGGVGIGRNVDPSSFNFTKMTTNTWEAGISGLYFDMTYMKKSPPWKIDYHFKLQTTFVQFPRTTATNKTYNAFEMANISALGFQHAITYVSMTLSTLYSEKEISKLSDRDFQKIFYESAAFYISNLADGQAIVKNVSNNGVSTIITPVKWIY